LITFGPQGSPFAKVKKFSNFMAALFAVSVLGQESSFAYANTMALRADLDTPAGFGSDVTALHAQRLDFSVLF